MTTPHIKICGVTQPEDIALCEQFEVEYIGLNFVPSSPRFLSLEAAQELRSAMKATKAVGVFADMPMEEVEELAEVLSLDMVQLHGNEDADDIRSIDVPVIKAFRYVPWDEELETYLFAGASIMLDGQANGSQADWKTITQLPEELCEQLWLAGGLNPDNVAEAIKDVHPYAVDCASGVEQAPGIKDPLLLKTFVDVARSQS